MSIDSQEIATGQQPVCKDQQPAGEKSLTISQDFLLRCSACEKSFGSKLYYASICEKCGELRNLILSYSQYASVEWDEKKFGRWMR